MTFPDQNSPTQAELEALRVECAKEAGWTTIFGWESESTRGYAWYKDEEDMRPLPLYATSYDAILPEIQKLDRLEAAVFGDKLNYNVDAFCNDYYDGWTALDTSFCGAIHKIVTAKPWQLSLAWLRTKQQNRKEL